MPARDADATRQRLVDAGRAEFAQYGIAGARVDRIAADAQSNKAQIYHYFHNKDGLFDAVWEAMVQQVVDEAPLDVTDLPGYAAQLSDGYAQHPDIVRLVTWQRLERGSDPPHVYATRSTQTKIDAIAKAQADGGVPDHFDAPVLLALILHIAALWAMSSPDVLAVVKESSAKKRREAVRQAVAAILAPTP